MPHNPNRPAAPRTASRLDDALARRDRLVEAVEATVAAAEPLVIDVGDYEVYTALVNALTDHAAELRDDIAARLDLFGDDSITVERLRRELTTAERLLEAVTA